MIQMFEGMGHKLTIGKYVEEFNCDLYNSRSIDINGKTYDASGSNDWGTAFNSGFKLVESLLEDLELKERVFGLFMDETTTLIILNEVQFEYLTNIIPEGSTYRPFDLKAMMP